ncbi:MAG: hypothetical protein NZ895_06460 [Archaeoglobaceae archaeon]|nr:hypothetical protein [Archaeoglobaceae archaeon]MCX8152303.1 hypothetical protein [Archaeoglobaceae archaeon]MDW8013981.1 hypothetical protein [Archaeoglobaceae archaeon]
MNSKAVSEVTSYMFILGIVMVSITYALVQVSMTIKDVSDKNKIEGLRESFKRIQNIFFLSAYGGAPLQTIQLEIQGGKLYLSPEPKVMIKIDDHVFLEDFIGSLIFEYGDFTVSIENGAVYENYFRYKRTTVDPRIFIQKVEVQGVPGSYHKVLTVIIYRIHGNLSVSGLGAVKLIFSSKVNGSVLVEEPGTLILEIENSQFSDRWWEYLNILEASVVPKKRPEPGEVVRAEIPFDKLVLIVLDVDVKYKVTV